MSSPWPRLLFPPAPDALRIAGAEHASTRCCVHHSRLDQREAVTSVEALSYSGLQKSGRARPGTISSPNGRHTSMTTCSAFKAMPSDWQCLAALGDPNGGVIWDTGTWNVPPQSASGRSTPRHVFWREPLRSHHPSMTLAWCIPSAAPTTQSIFYNRATPYRTQYPGGEELVRDLCSMEGLGSDSPTLGAWAVWPELDVASEVRFANWSSSRWLLKLSGVQ